MKESPKIEYSLYYVRNPKTIYFGKYNDRMYAVRMFHSPCVYIEVKENEDYDRLVDLLDEYVHCGVSYRMSTYPSEENLDSRWIGWDYGHHCDYSIFSEEYTNEGKKWTFEEIEHDIRIAIDITNEYCKTLERLKDLEKNFSK